MTVVFNDPSWWPVINTNIFNSYWIVAAVVVVVYDWVLTLGQEIELIWRQRLSLMTVLYLLIRYIEMPYSVANVLRIMPSISLTDAGCINAYYAQNGTNVVVSAMLGVVMIARLHAMYQGSRMMLIFLVIIFLAVNITCGVIVVMVLKDSSAKEFILYGTHMCTFAYVGNSLIMSSMVWTINTVWEVLALFLSVWITVKHFRNLRRLRASSIGDCFRVMIQSHVLYFASFACVSCLQLVYLSPKIVNPYFLEILQGALQILSVVQMFVLGPRLILSVREYSAGLVVDFDTKNSMTSIVFQERVHVSTSSTV